MNKNKIKQKQKEAEDKRKMKALRQEMEEELLKQWEEAPKGAPEAVTSEEIDTAEDLDPDMTKRVIEALLFSSSKPLTIPEIRKVLRAKKPSEIERIVDALALEYENDGRSFRIQKIAGGYELSTDRKYAPWIVRLEKQKKARQATQSALETLAIIAYRQPLSRVEIEELRGVDCSGVLTTLVERALIKIVGRKEVPGRPFVYGTTDTFLEHFGLAGLNELPNIEDIKGLVDHSIRKDDLLKRDSAVIVDNVDYDGSPGRPAGEDAEKVGQPNEIEAVEVAAACSSGSADDEDGPLDPRPSAGDERDKE